MFCGCEQKSGAVFRAAADVQAVTFYPRTKSFDGQRRQLAHTSLFSHSIWVRCGLNKQGRLSVWMPFKLGLTVVVSGVILEKPSLPHCKDFTLLLKMSSSRIEQCEQGLSSHVATDSKN